MLEVYEPNTEITVNKKSRDFFLDVFKNLPVASYVVCSQKFTIQAANRKFLDLSGYTYEDILDKSVSDIIPEQKHCEFFLDLENLEKPDQEVSRDTVYLLKENKEKKFKEKVSTVEFGSEDNKYLLFLVEEVVDNSAVAKLLTAFLENTSDEVSVISSDDRILLANKTFCARHKIPPNKIGTPGSANLIGGQSTADKSMHQAVLETEGTRRQLLSYTLEDGSSAMYSTVKFPVAMGDDNGMAVGTLATNISAFSKSAKEVQDRENQIRMITDSLHVLIFHLDQNMKFKYMNKTGEEWWAVPAQDFLGKHYSEIIGEELFEQRRPYLEEAMSGKTVTHETVTTYPDGVTRNINITYIPHRSNKGEPLGFFALIEDITERKKIEEQLSRTSKMEGIGQLAAGIAHEINTPIQYIGDNLGFLKDASEDMFDLVGSVCDYLEESGDDESKLKVRDEIKDKIDAIDLEFLKEDVPDAIDRSLHGVKDVARIILSMKDFTHPNTKEKSTVDLNQCLKNTLTISRNEWKQVASIVEEFDPEIPTILGFPGELSQVFLNIIVNAAHAIQETGSEEMGTITVATKRIDGGVSVSIADSGPGIPEDVRERIFEPFFTTKEVGKGTGQGLAISWDIIVNKHGGTIEVSSDPETGTTFNINFQDTDAGAD